MDYKKLFHAVEAAKSAALTKIDTIDDGTCNFDCPIVNLPDDVDDEELEAHGITLKKITYGFWDGSYEIRVPLHGQAGRRTAMAEAAAKCMTTLGYNATVWYQMD